MATLVLTAVGTAFGGPIGGAIGAVIGQQIDGRLFAPKPRQGPRLGELAVQTSSYGSQIPKLFGTMRVAGTVIWATDLREERSKSGGGKGQPKTVDYSYSANFAVALSARPIRAVRRIWADGKLLRGSAGDFKTATRYRLHLGGEDQAVDPLIASAEGAGLAPAYRGTAYAVFEDFQLADYGNRIPSLTFEVEADPGPVSLGAVAAELGGGLATDGPSVALAGYAASGDSIRAAIAVLAELEPLSLVDDGEQLVLASGGGPPVTVAEDELGAAARGAGGRGEWLRRSGDSVPAETTLAYYDPARDHQTGLQRASRPGAALVSDRRAVAASLGAATAKALAERRLDRLWAERRSAKLHLGWGRLGLPAGSSIRVAGHPGLWKLVRWTLDRMVLTLELSGIPAGPAGPPAGANPGRPVDQPDHLHGPTSFLLLDLPLLAEALPSRPRLLVAAAGVEPGWRRAALVASFDGGASWTAAGSTAPPAVIGTALGAPVATGSALLDERSRFEVELLNEAMWLESRSDAALAGGANLAALGAELFQFGTAEPLGGRRFRLSRLLRGRRGTEWAAGSHAPGEPFALIEAESLAGIEAPLGALGGEARLIAGGLGDPDGVAAARAVTGEALRPPSPVHLRAEARPNGDLALSWVRRSRNGWVWLSGSDTPLGEESESYRLTLSGAGFERRVILSAPAYLYSAAEQAADGLAGPLTIEVVQLGTSAPSRPASIVTG
ncbi:MAG TPA: phage tail protein [Allosphingosinicella sp.]|nr:phage tail protein [Allosphingosinicella sp.]